MNTFSPHKINNAIHKFPEDIKFFSIKVWIMADFIHLKLNLKMGASVEPGLICVFLTVSQETNELCTKEMASQK